MSHAWIVMDDGNVVDFTLEATLQNARRDGTCYDDRPPLYRGLHVETDLLEEKAELQRQTNSL